jgi:hypothetical protein
MRHDDSNGKFELWNHFSEVFWGFGARPLRLILWMTIIYLLFTLVYYIELLHRPGVARANREAHKHDLKILRQILYFSFRNSLTLTYGFERSRTLLYKIITLFQAVLAKAMLVLLFQAFANISPLLHDFLGKIVPV